MQRNREIEKQIERGGTDTEKEYLYKIVGLEPDTKYILRWRSGRRVFR